MKAHRSLLSAFCVCLAGCINLPQTKALITPVGIVGVHSFAPPPEAAPQPDKRSMDFKQRVAQQRKASPHPLERS